MVTQHNVFIVIAYRPPSQGWRNDPEVGRLGLGALEEKGPQVSQRPKPPIQLLLLLKNCPREIKRAHFIIYSVPGTAPGPTQELELMGSGGEGPSRSPPPPGFSSHAPYYTVTENQDMIEALHTSMSNIESCLDIVYKWDNYDGGLQSSKLEVERGWCTTLFSQYNHREGVSWIVWLPWPLTMDLVSTCPSSGNTLSLIALQVFLLEHPCVTSDHCPVVFEYILGNSASPDLRRL